MAVKAKQVKVVKRQPTIDDLISWWLFWKLDGVKYVELPEQIQAWIHEVRIDKGGVWADLYKNYSEFRKQFTKPPKGVVEGGTLVEREIIND